MFFIKILAQKAPAGWLSARNLRFLIKYLVKKAPAGWLSAEIYVFLIWTYQKIEQVHPDVNLILPGPETFNFDEFFDDYCKKVKICMRPWIGRLCYYAKNK